MGIEMDHRHPAVAQDIGAALGVGEGDRVVSTEHDRDRPAATTFVTAASRPQRLLDVTGRHLDVTRVDDHQVAQGISAQRQ